MHLLGWLDGWRTNWASQAFAARRVRRRAGSGIEPLETRLVLASPTVSSIVPDPTQQGTNIDNARFVVTFSEVVTGVDPADFVAVPGPGVIVTPVPPGVTGSGTTYTVTVSGVSGVGTLGVNLVDNNSIRDLGGNSLVGNGDGTFQAAQSFAAGSTFPFSVAVGDVNGDGRLDLAVANYVSNAVSVLLGNGNGTFQAAQSFPTGTGPVSVSVGDLNGDGRLDLAAANSNSDTVSVLLGNGNGTFQAALNFATGENPQSEAVGDLNGDGRLDLAVTSGDSNFVSVLLGNGNGTFQTAQNFGTGVSPVSVAVGDLNGDGRLDLAVANRNSNTASVLLGNGNGTFQAAQNLATGSLPASVAVGDVNGDGRLDLAVANDGSNTVSVLLGNGNGTFQTAQNLASGMKPYSVSVGDLNGDGRPDLAVANANSATVSVLVGNGDGTFQPARNFSAGFGPVSVAMGDLNGDSRLDLAIANANVGTVNVLLNAATGSFTGQTRAVAVTAPTAVSIVPDPSQVGTDLGTPRFVVTFSEDVTGVDPADFVAAPGPGVVVAPGPLVVTGSGTTYTVTVNGVSGVGTLGLNLVDNNSIRDLGGNRLVGNGDGTFQDAQSFDTGANPHSVVVGDVSGDGRLDLAVANRLSNTVSVMLGNGDGTFQAAQNFSTGVQPFSVAAGDVNGDGRLDLAIANFGSSTVSVLLGNGNGTFQAAQNFATGTGPYSISVGDVNGDGRLDLAVANYGSGTVSVLLGNGNGMFQAAQNFAAGVGPVSLLMGDVNGDGRLDLAVANFNSSTVSVLLGNGNGTFQVAQNFATGVSSASVAVGDVNGDGRLDLAVANQNSYTVSVLLGNGNGAFQAAQNFATGAFPRSVAVGDVNGDGRLDLTVASGGSSTVSVLLGNGDGTFQAAQNFATGTGPVSVAVGDLNGDGLLDLATANLNSNSVSVLLNAANGSFTGQTRAIAVIAPTVVSIVPDPTQPATNVSNTRFVVTFSETVTGVDPADFVAVPGSGVTVAPGPLGVTGSGTTYTVTVNGVSGVGMLGLNLVDNSSIRDLGGNGLVGNGNGTFQAAQNFGTGASPRSVAVGDLNGDGRSDLAVANRRSDTVSVLLGNGNGTFQPALNFATGSAPYSVSVGDLNGDGRSDLAVVNVNSDTVSVLLGNGNGTFQPALNFATGNSPVSVAVGDVNGDGRLDLAVANASDNSVSVLLGNGNGAFQAAVNFAAGVGPISVSVGDLNGDGSLDLAVANFFGNTVSVLLGNGSGTFEAAQNFATGARPASVTAGDVNGDGLLDLAVANFNGDSVGVLLGNGNGTFQAAQTFPTGDAPYSIAMGDLNGDGRLDLAVANLNSSTVSVLLGNGNGGFQAAQNFATGPNPRSVATGDLNGDGRLDLAVANYYGESLGVLLNAANGNFTGQNRAVDTVAPTVASILRQNPLAAVTGADQLTFRVTFTEAVQSVSISDFALGGTSAADGSINSLSPLSPSVYDVLITGVDSSNGTIQLLFAPGQDITDLATNSLTNTTAATTETYTLVNNRAPTALALGTTTLAENVAIGAAIGTFTSTDPDAGNTFTYSLVAGSGSADNGSFTIVGNQLRSNAVFDFETRSSYAIRVRTTDQGGLTFEQTFTIAVTNVNEQPTALTLSNATLSENLATGAAIGTFTSTDPDAGNTFTYSLVAGSGSADNGSFTIIGNQLRSNAVFNFETKSSYAIRVRTTDQGNLPFESTFTVNVTNVQEAPVLDASGNPFAILGAGSRQSTEMRQGTLVSDILARGAGGNPISDPDAGAQRGIALTAVDQSLGNFQYTLVTNNPQESDWVNVDAAGALSNTSALLLPTTTRLRFNTGRIPHHASAPFFLSVESKLDAGLTFRAWDQTAGAAGGRADTSTNGGSCAFSSATETSKVYFEVRLFRSFNPNASLNVYTLEAEFNALTGGAFQDRSTSSYTGFTVLLSPVPELGTSALLRLYYGIQFNDTGTETDMGYRYLTSNGAEAEFLEGIGPASKRPQREGTYFRELGVSNGTATIGYVFTTQQPGTSELTQIYRTDVVDKPTRPPGTSEGGTPTSFKPQENGDHVYTTNTAFETTKLGMWRIEATRGFVRELNPNPVAGAATAAAISDTAPAAAAAAVRVDSLTPTTAITTRRSAVVPVSLPAFAAPSLGFPLASDPIALRDSGSRSIERLVAIHSTAQQAVSASSHVGSDDPDRPRPSSTARRLSNSMVSSSAVPSHAVRSPVDPDLVFLDQAFIDELTVAI